MEKITSKKREINLILPSQKRIEQSLQTDKNKHGLQCRLNRGAFRLLKDWRKGIITKVTPQSNSSTNNGWSNGGCR